MLCGLCRLGGDIITVLVGSGGTATKYYIHADVATQHSDFFNAALKRGWKEAQERIVRLPDLPEDAAGMFEDFYSFLYMGKIYSGDDDEVNKPGRDKEWTRLSDSWILGEVLLSTTFKDAVVDAVVHKIVVTGDVPTSLHARIYSYGSHASSIRRLLVNIAIHEWEEEDISAVEADANSAVNATFLQDVAIALFKMKKFSKTEQAKSRITLESSCLYHEHGADKPCYKTMFG